MKRLLLDTHVVLWWLADAPQLGARARELIADERNDLFVSAVSGWEISIKSTLGKLEVPEEIQEVIEEEGFELLPIRFFHGLQAGRLPPLHRDPFDRMLIAQAQAEGLDLMTSDGVIARYGIRILDASR